MPTMPVPIRRTITSCCTSRDGTRIVYNDPRRFGFMVMMPHAERDAHALFRDLGVEPLGNELTAEYLASRGRGKKANLKSFLMDQRVIAGLGNIYVSEALYRAGLSPNRSASSLADRRGKPATEACRSSLRSETFFSTRSMPEDRRCATIAAPTAHRALSKNSIRGLRSRRSDLPQARMWWRNTARTLHAGRASFHCPRCQR